MLKLNNISKTFSPGTVNEKHVIKDLNLHIKEGDFVTVIGGNGAGKSTLLNLVTGVHFPDIGEIILKDSKTIRENERRKEEALKKGGEYVPPVENPFITLQRIPEHRRAAFFGRVFQDPMLGSAPDMAIEENLAMAFRRGKTRGLGWGIRNEERAFYKERLLTLGLGLEDRLQSKVGLLSGGQRQALTLLMATLQRPDLLLLDEHTAALDPKTAARVLELTEEIVVEQGLTTLMITHNMKDAIRIGNRLIMMYDGQIVYDVSGEEKKRLEIADLMAKFDDVSDGSFANDRMMFA